MPLCFDRLAFRVCQHRVHRCFVFQLYVDTGHGSLNFSFVGVNLVIFLVSDAVSFVGSFAPLAAITNGDQDQRSANPIDKGGDRVGPSDPDGIDHGQHGRTGSSGERVSQKVVDSDRLGTAGLCAVNEVDVGWVEHEHKGKAVDSVKDKWRAQTTSASTRKSAEGPGHAAYVALTLIAQAIRQQADWLA